MWSSRYAALGSTFELCAPEPVASRLADLFRSYAPAPPGTVDLRYRVELEPATIWRGEHRIYTSLSELDLAPRIERDLLDRLLERCHGWTLHAAAISIGGVAVVVAGASGSGKSTLCAALCEAGAGYLSDELVVIAQHGAFALPRPIVCDGEWNLPETTHEMRDVNAEPIFERHFHPPCARLTQPAPIGAIAVVRRDDAICVDRMGAAQALAALWPHTANVGRDTLEMAMRIVDSHRCFDVRTGPQVLSGLGALALSRQMLES